MSRLRKYHFEGQQEGFFLERRKLNPLQPKHEHEFFEVLFIISGERNFFLGDRIYHARPGDFMLISPHTLHTAMVNTNRYCECILLYFKKSFLNDPGLMTQLLPGYEKIFLRPSLQDREQIESLMEQMLFENQQEEAGYQVMIRAVLQRLIVLLHRILPSYEEEPQHLSPKHEKIAQVIQFIRENYREPLSLKVLAEEFYLSPPYLSKIFKEITNYNFVEYLNCLRVAEAKKELQRGGQKIIDIAEDVGFGSVTHFNRVFREVTGHSPKYFRSTTQLVSFVGD